MFEVGLLAMPVKLYRATREADYAFHQVHREDAGQVRYRKHCEECGKRVEDADIAKAVTVGEQKIVFTDEELESLPQADKVIRITQFVPAGVVDLRTFGTAYNINPDDAGFRAYTLLRQQLKDDGKAGIAQFSMSGKDTLALVYPYGKTLVLQRVCWPSEVAEPDFKILRTDVQVTDAERKLARQLLDTMTAPWEPDGYRSEWWTARQKIIEARLAGEPAPEPSPERKAAAIDIGAVLSASIAAEKSKQKEKAGEAV
jgi:DNA end-binding protein Ku